MHVHVCLYACTCVCTYLCEFVCVHVVCACVSLHGFEWKVGSGDTTCALHVDSEVQLTLQWRAFDSITDGCTAVTREEFFIFCVHGPILEWLRNSTAESLFNECIFVKRACPKSQDGKYRWAHFPMSVCAACSICNFLHLFALRRGKSAPVSPTTFYLQTRI